MTTQIDGIIIRSRSLIGPVAVADKVIAAGDLEAVTQTSTELQARYQQRPSPTLMIGQLTASCQ